MPLPLGLQSLRASCRGLAATAGARVAGDDPKPPRATEAKRLGEQAPVRWQALGGVSVSSQKPR